MKHLILEIIKDIIFTFVFYFGVVFFGCKVFGDNPFDLKLFIIVFITFSLVCICFDVIDFIYAKRSKSEVQDD
jgi:ABC-type multidrug transport system permease subunit